MPRRRWRSFLGLGTALAVTAGLGWYWAASLLPGTYSVIEMGQVETGGGPAPGAHDSGGPSVADLTGPASGEPDVAVDLEARQGTIRLASGEEVEGYTLDGTSPGPPIQARQGDLVQVTLTNAGIPEGVTLHWHGVDVPNAEDGVAGVTQDAVRPGGSHVYRFVAEDAGTYWYHSHQVSSEQVRGGLFGTLVVRPPGPPGVRDVVVPVHTYSGLRTVAGSTGLTTVAAEPGERIRVRLVNTDDGPLPTWVTGGPFRIAAVDGADVNEPTDISGQGVLVSAGGRVDLLVTAPARVDVGAGAALVLAPGGTDLPAAAVPDQQVDLLDYGSPAPLPFDPEQADRAFRYDIGRGIGLLDGRPGFWWTINGSVFPDVPRYAVEEGDVVRMTIRNDSGDVHPMHLHGHRLLVLARDGVAATGSPWWTDSLHVPDGATFEVAFVADNPGVWTFHCHNLGHARDGLVAHLAYAGVTEPFRIGGEAANEPE